jgi:monoamine oxidase
MKIVPNPNTNLSIIKFFLNLLVMHTDPKASTQKVVIVGAGAAGLKASRLLRKASISVVLLAARDRIGGRIHTSCHSLTTALGNQVTVLHDEGAAWTYGLVQMQ